ncbi:3-ketoacyl-CoA thiolase [Zhongshania aliphaticivorans]|uniref:propanoyl-CoA C-acyltransferase n=1 Tax=Zhongshania aliphaticivorans TaxID=1470434 RepID=A0A5S9MRP5_9GAMM|nr:3-ketoacyl-CoA thiolase [Zhongshania aliphaticivorans]CAA0085994.1 3-ketoacyl-CoA thiolase [Zhongshania aliphaticivorans]
MTGIPVVNVNNNCASGSSAIFLARQAILSGQAECVLALGFEEMPSGAISSMWADRESPFDVFDNSINEFDYPMGPLALRCFGAAGHYYLEQYNAKPELFAQVAVKTRKHAQNNPYALFNSPLTVSDVLTAPVLYKDYLTRLMCCPPTCGAAAAIICSPDFAKHHGLTRGVNIVAQSMVTDIPASFNDPMNLVGAEMSRKAAEQAYEQAGVGPEDLNVVELHDCFTTNEVISYEALGFCGEGEATKFVSEGDNTYGGKLVINPSGGLMSKGHPIGATGLAQCFELTTQLRGEAGARQVGGAVRGLQHNLGLGGAAVVTIYSRDT